MKANQNRISPRKWRNWMIMALIALTVAGLSWALLNESISLNAQSEGPAVRPRLNQGVFTPAHSSAGQAVRHFFGIRPEPVQPFPYTHQVHIERVQMQCVDCHEGVATGPMAKIPGINTCWGCHEFVVSEAPALKTMAEYIDRGEDFQWQRVYGWNEEAHVRFNHSPHIKAEVQCATCHGDVGQMTVAERVVDHSMGFCINCHKERGASNDCLTCHF